MASDNRRICCVEGFYEYGDKEPTIKPMLELLSQWDYWPHVHMQCGTVHLAKAFLGEKWNESDYNSVLFFATHGSAGSITLSESESISLGELARDGCLSGQCEGCYVHFSACNVLEDESAVRDFLQETGAAAVSGYRTDVGWAENDKPALPLDLMLLNQLYEKGIDFSDAKSFRPKLRKIELNLQRRFGDCQFRIVQR